MMKFGIGQPVTRTEDPRLVRGHGRYIDDINLPGQAYAHIIRSPYAHAKIKSIETTDALATPSVLAVLTGSDYEADELGTFPCHIIPIPMLAGPPTAPPQPALYSDRALFVGAPVAVVIAETHELAKEVAENINIDYEELSPLTTVDQAMAEGAAQLWPGTTNNTGLVIDVGNPEETEAVLETAHHVTELSLVNNRITANAIEMRGALGAYSVADTNYTLYSSSQRPHSVREDVAAVLGVPESKLRVISDDVGGGFGMKGGAYPEELLVLWASKKIGRPVKWRCDRIEAFTSDRHARDQVVNAVLAFDDQANILALKVDAVFDVGAFLTSAGTVPPMDSANLMSGVYRIPSIHSKAAVVYTNKSPTHPYRGAGRPEAAYLLERLLDRAASEMGIDRVELRRTNLIKPDEMPYQTPLLTKYDCGDFETVMDQALDVADWGGFDERASASKARGLLRGRGLSLCLESAAELNEQMEIRFDPSGAATIVAGTHSHGQGHQTVYAQMLADWLGIPFESIGFIQGDTDAVSFGRGTFASRSIGVGGSALRRAANQIIERGKTISAHVLEGVDAANIEFEDGIFIVPETNRNITLSEVIRASFDPMLPDHLGLGLQATASFAPPDFNYPNSCQIVEVEIDKEIGSARIDRYYVVADVGTVLNPLLLDGQLVGGIVQGTGQALYEDMRYDVDSGQLLSASFMDYTMPRADDLSAINVLTHEDVPTATNPLGAKGAGECGTVGAAPAVISAVLDALSALGVIDIEMPATPARIWNAIEEARIPPNH